MRKFTVSFYTRLRLYDDPMHISAYEGSGHRKTLHSFFVEAETYQSAFMKAMEEWNENLEKDDGMVFLYFDQLSSIFDIQITRH